MFQVFLVFLKIGAFTFGGGYAMIPIIYDELCERRNLFTEDEMDKIIVISQSLPGVLAVNCATQVGYRLFGAIGAVTCTIGMVLPSFVIIIALAGLIIKYRTNELIADAFFMIRAAVVGLIASAAFKMGKNIFQSPLQVLLLFTAFLMMYIGKVNPAILILCGGLIGLLATHQEASRK